MRGSYLQLISNTALHITLLSYRKVVSQFASEIPLCENSLCININGIIKVKVTFYLTSVVPSVPTRLLSMEADGAPSTRDHLSIQNRRVGGYSSTFGQE